MINHKDNTALYNLYVTYAQEELQLYQQIIEDLNSFSRVNPSIIVEIIKKERTKLIRENIAYQEAAWRILSGDLLLPEAETSV